jgi:hypothetical protein
MAGRWEIKKRGLLLARADTEEIRETLIDGNVGTIDEKICNLSQVGQ